jgi:exoribonuclease R
LAARRIRLGSLTLETRQTRAIFAGDSLAELAPERRNRAKQVIEEFMIAANGATARYLGDRQFPSLRRVLRSPERWGRIAQLAADLGHPLPATANAQALEEFLQQQRRSAPDSFADLSLAIVKLIGRGEYVLEIPGNPAPGHFGLAVRDYTHSTAPNRRFPDLITQRLLKAALAEDSLPYSVAELIDLARHCTEREDAANKVERQVQKSAAALMLTGRLGDRFEAVVTGASAKGTWVRIESPPVEGRLERGTAGLDVGDRIRVRLVHTDVQRGFIDFDRDVTHPG